MQAGRPGSKKTVTTPSRENRHRTIPSTPQLHTHTTAFHNHTPHNHSHHRPLAHAPHHNAAAAAAAAAAGSSRAELYTAPPRPGWLQSHVHNSQTNAHQQLSRRVPPRTRTTSAAERRDRPTGSGRHACLPLQRCCSTQGHRPFSSSQQRAVGPLAAAGAAAAAAMARAA
jgi:hypothetical protein